MILPWKKKDGADEVKFVPSPEKARPYLDRATKARDQSAFDVALFYYANSIKLDPTNLIVHEEMYACAKQFHANGGKPATSAEVRPLEGPLATDRLAIAELYWMRDPNNLNLALDMMTAAAKAEQTSFGAWVGPKVFNLLCLTLRDKPNKKLLLRAKDLFIGVGSWEEAKLCVEHAIKVDPTDIQLDREFKQILAQRAIVAGGFDREGGPGSFRNNVKDLEKQQALAEKDAITGSAGTEERNLERTKADFDANPTSPDLVQKYCVALRRMGTPEHESLAYRVYLQAYETSKEYRFKMAAGDIKLMRAGRQLSAAEDAAKNAPTDEAARANLARVRKAVVELQATEYRERVAVYPTDRAIKSELGRLLFELGEFEEAMGCLQIAKEEPKMRVAAAHMLGRCFAVSGWHTEAIGEYKDAIASMDVTQADREQDIRYDLMLSLIELARSEKSAQHARDAAEICSGILRKDISFRDIRQRRKDLDALVKELS